MKLYLSSYRLVNDTSFLQNWINQNSNAIIDSTIKIGDTKNIRKN